MNNKRVSLFGLALAVALGTQIPAISNPDGGPSANGGGFPVGGNVPPPNRTFIPPPFANTPPPIVVTGGGPVTIISAPDGFTDPLLPTDIVKSTLVLPVQQVPNNIPVAGGIKGISDTAFYKKNQGDESSEYVLVRGDANSIYEKTTPISVKLTAGNILVSVRRPSRYCLINTPEGQIALDADGDVLVSYNDGVIRVDNLSSRGIRCKAKLDGKVLDGKSQAVAIAPGYEMVASDHSLTRSDVRPADGIARRGFELIANGHIAVNEFSVESFLNSSTIIASLVGSTADVKEHRVLNDMSKMAAVLNYVNGANGYSTGTTGLASKPGAGTQ